MMEYLNANAGGIQAIFGCLIFFVTLAYAIVSYFMWKEMKKNRLKFETPDVSILLIQQKASQFEIEISNLSNVDIFDLTFIEFPDLKIFPKGTKNIGFLKNGISYLGVGQHYRSMFLNAVLYIDEIDDDETHYLIFKYKFFDKPQTDIGRKEYQKEIRINFSLIANTARSTMFDVAAIEQLKELNENIKNIGNNISD